MPRVRFTEETDVVIEIPHFSDLSTDEFDQLWFTKNDYHEMRKEARTITRAVMDGTAPKKTDLRGLEDFSGTKRREDIEDSVTTVVAAYDRQMEAHAFDPEAVRNIYLAATAHFAEEARARGQHDAKTDSPLGKIVARTFGKSAKKVSTRLQRTISGKASGITKRRNWMLKA